MNYIIILFILICGFHIYKKRGQERFNWFICTMVVFSSSIIILNKPQLPSHRFLIICYWLSVLRHNEFKLKGFPLKIPLIIYIIGLLLIGFHAEHLNFFYKLYKPFVLLLDTYFIILLTYCGIRKESFYSKAIINTLFFVTVYGILTFIIRSNPIQEIVSSAIGNELELDYYWGQRVRICSTWSHPISYGFICSVFFYELLPFAQRIKVKVLLILLTINVLICGSRTALASLVLMGVIYIMSRYKISKSILKALGCILLFIPIYLFIPIVQEKVDSVVFTVMGKDDVAGSSLEMRETQTELTLAIAAESPLFGHGFDYIQEVMHYGTDEFTGDRGLQGFESYLYIILIERGLLGIVIELIILFSIIRYALKWRKIDKLNSSLILSCCVGYIFFSNSTGVLDTDIPTIFMIGFSISKMQINNYEKSTSYSYSGL